MTRALSRASPACVFSCCILGLFLGASGCAWLDGYCTPEGISRWQDPSPPKLSLREKARVYQERIEERHLMPEGLLKYSIKAWGRGQAGTRYGELGDGPFHTGIYLASQAFRHAATKDPAAGRQVILALRGLRTLMRVTGKRGLLARYFSPVGEPHPGRSHRWHESTTLPAYAWKDDASKDQYAGFIHGIGVTLALVDLPEARAMAVDLAAQAADHLMEHDLHITDADGQATTYGDLRGRLFIVPIGVNALICLAIAKTAAVSTGEARHGEFYRKLIEDGYSRLAFWAYFTLFGIGNRVNDNMAYLALTPLLLLEKDKSILSDLRRAERRSWDGVREDRNAFFSFVHAGLVGDPGYLLEKGQSPKAGGIERGRQALFEFPDDKLEWPVDLTRPGFDFPRALFNSRSGEPRTTRGVPLYLRPRRSSFWASDPFRLVGTLNQQGDQETAGADYLLAYWMGRYFGFISPEE